MTKNEILQYLHMHKAEFSQRYNVEKMALFGSFARNEAQAKSDIDIVYSLKKGAKMSYDKYIELEESLRKSFNANVDLVNEKKLNPLVKIHALKDFIYV